MPRQTLSEKNLAGHVDGSIRCKTGGEGGQLQSIYAQGAHALEQVAGGLGGVHCASGEWWCCLKL